MFGEDSPSLVNPICAYACVVGKLSNLGQNTVVIFPRPLKMCLCKHILSNNLTNS